MKEAPAPNKVIINQDEIIKAVRVYDFAINYLGLPPDRGSSNTKAKVPCPFCGKKAEIINIQGRGRKNILKCFHSSCGKSLNPYKYLREVQSKGHFESMEILAQVAGIPIEYSIIEKKSVREYNGFRDLQLAGSGLVLADTETAVRDEIDEDTEILHPRYTSGTWNEKFEVVAGSDMICHYVGLDGKFLTYFRKRKDGTAYGNAIPFVRVRFQFPDEHLDKNSKPIKYKSPPNSGVHLWFPSKIIKAFRQKIHIKTLYVIEGEKKADVVCKLGLFCIGIGGIHNFAENSSIHPDFRRIIEANKVENVVYLTDSDFDQLNSNPKENINWRILSFLAALRKFQQYFVGIKQGYDLDINLFYGHVNHGIKVKETDTEELKGVDDVYVWKCDKVATELFNDLDMGVKDISYHGQLIKIYNLAGYGETKLKEIFHAGTKEQLFEYHKEQLKQRGTFLFNGTEYSWLANEDGSDGRFDVSQPLMPDEIFWDESRDRKNGMVNYTFLKFNFDNFLKRHNIGEMQLGVRNNKISRTVIADFKTKIITSVEAKDIRRFTNELVKVNGYIPVYNWLHNTDQLKDAKIQSHIPFIEIPLLKPNSKLGYLFFQNEFWRINAEGIKAEIPAEIGGYIWQSQQIDSPAQILKTPLCDIGPDPYRPAEWTITEKYDTWLKCDFFRFLFNTCNFSTDKLLWENRLEYAKTEKGAKFFEKEMSRLTQHLMNKLTSIGYLSHRHFDMGKSKVIVAIDGMRVGQNEGESKGRSGKSLIGEALRFITNVEVIDGKAPKINDDSNTYGNVTEQTAIVFIDDARRSFDFERLLSMLMNFQVRTMYKQQWTIPKEFTPKIYLTTNHSIKGAQDNDSFAHRIHYMVFSDFYGKDHEPIDDFGGLFFEDWDDEQRNLFYNLIAFAQHLYFKFGLVEAPAEDIEQKQTLTIAGPVLPWFRDYFFTEEQKIDKQKVWCGSGKPTDYKFEKKKLYDEFIGEVKKNTGNWLDIKEFRKKFDACCTITGLIMNPYRKRINTKGDFVSIHGGACKMSGVEYFIVASKDHLPSSSPDAVDDENPMMESDENPFEDTGEKPPF